MRPRKLILVLDPNPDSLGVTMFSLSIRGFAVVGAATVTQAWDIMRDQAEKNRPIEGMVHRSLGTFAKAVELPFPVIAIDKMDTAEIIERLKTACARKRGPKPGWKLGVIFPQVAEENICNSAKVAA